ncbi:MAG TPA: hypothetical protein PK490_12905 [Prosthecobacter sp.]|nr:hypothetical protein [Prosthecobacter sp.]HRK15186.1 hypothetical protein [Prosthecobacter sp.]
MKPSTPALALVLSCVFTLCSCGTRFEPRSMGSPGDQLSFHRNPVPARAIRTTHDAYSLGQDYGNWNASAWRGYNPWRYRNHLRLHPSMWPSFVDGYKAGFRRGKEERTWVPQSP